MQIILLFLFTVLCFSCNQQEKVSDSATQQYLDVSYVDDTLYRHKMDIYVPGGLTQPAPLVVYIHGGAFRAGEKGNAMQYTDSLFTHGYVIADINYRLSQDSVFPALIYDCKTAVRFLKTQAEKYSIDTAQVGLIGHSAGGYLVAFLGTSMGVDSLEGYHLGSTEASSDVQAVMDFFGPTDFLEMDPAIPLTPPDSCENLFIHDEPNSPESQLLGCLISECPDRVKAANPITYVDGNEAPIALHHGTFDCLVPPNQSELLYNRLQSVNADADLVLHPHMPHGGPYWSTPEMKGEILQFFDSKLRADSSQ